MPDLLAIINLSGQVDLIINGWPILNRSQMTTNGEHKIKINMTTTKAPDTTYASISVAIFGLFGSVLLKMYSFIGEASFVSLLVFSSVVSLVIYFKPSIEEFSLELTGVKAKLKPIESIIAKETEPKSTTNTESIKSQTQGISMSMKGYVFSPEMAMVIFSLGSEKYTWRHLNGISQDAGLSPEATTKILECLVTDGLVTELQSQGEKVWGLTPEGRDNLPIVIRWKNKRTKKTGQPGTGGDAG